MNNINLTKGVFVALLLVSAMAGAEDQYPASDFQPKVVFQDEDAGKQSGGSSSSSSSASTTSSSSSSSSGDSDYPAANFQPKVVYADENYKHEDTVSSSSSVGSVTSAAPAAAPSDGSSAGWLLGLIVLGIAGYVLFKKGTGIGSSKTASSANASGLTGVGRYLLKTSGTGVTRYLEKHAKSAPASATGVAKYLATHGKAAASQAATGVEKYMRNKG